MPVKALIPSSGPQGSRRAHRGWALPGWAARMADGSYRLSVDEGVLLLDGTAVPVGDAVAAVYRQVAAEAARGVITDVRWSGNGGYLLVTSHDDQQVHIFRSSDWKLLGELAPYEATADRTGVWAGGVADDGTVLLAPQGSYGLDVFTLTS